MIITATKNIGALCANDLFKMISGAVAAAQSSQEYIALPSDEAKNNYIVQQVNNTLYRTYKFTPTQLGVVATKSGWTNCVASMRTCYETDLAHKDDPVDVQD